MKVKHKPFPEIKLELYISKHPFAKWKQYSVHSFSRSFNRMLYDLLSWWDYYYFNIRPASNLTEPTVLSVKDVNGSDHDPRSEGRGYAYCWGHTPLHRISVGSSNEDWSYTDYKLKSPIKDADSYYLSQNTVEDGTQISTELTGVFQFSESNTIWEVGLYGRFKVHSGADYQYLVSRDVLSSGIPVNAGDIYAVRYKLIVG